MATSTAMGMTAEPATRQQPVSVNPRSCTTSPDSGLVILRWAVAGLAFSAEAKVIHLKVDHQALIPRKNSIPCRGNQRPFRTA